MNSKRSLWVAGFVLFVGIAFIVKLYTIQVSDSSYKEVARSNVLKRVTVYPQRGLIYDRNGELIVYNEPVFDILVTPADIQEDLDEARFARLLGLPVEELLTRIQEAKEYSNVQASPVAKQLTSREFARVQDQLIDFPGFHVEARTIRAYPQKALAHVLGYIAEISAQQLDMPQYDNYNMGDYIGISGLESQYEHVLRGKRGVRYVLKNVQGLTKGSFKQGKFDTLPESGLDLQVSIDMELQKYGERLMQNKRGSIVAVEPESGEILAFVSSPGYDPNLLSGRKFGINFDTLQRDPKKPLFNRALQSQYPPGSIFKVFQALAAMQQGVVRKSSRFYSGTPFESHGHHLENLPGAIQYSSNPYFYHVFRRMIQKGQAPTKYKDAVKGMNEWLPYCYSFGFGKRLGVDIPNERPGLIPDVEYYNKVYGELRWKFSNIYSLSIGQGEISLTPLQMANMSAIVANKGWYKIPHFVKGIGPQKRIDSVFIKPVKTLVDSQHFNVVIPAMLKAVNRGTVTWRAKVDGLNICGKTGTAQNPHGDDHSVFTCFAPMENPKIALAVIVENGGYGGVTAAPIATFMAEHYLRGETERKEYQEHIINKSFEPKPKPKPRRQRAEPEEEEDREEEAAGDEEGEDDEEDDNQDDNQEESGTQPEE